MASLLIQHARLVVAMDDADDKEISAFEARRKQQMPWMA